MRKNLAMSKNNHSCFRSSEAVRQHLVDLAERVAEAYMTIPEVRAFIIFGSVADGLPDEHSDLDSVAFCQGVPSPTARRRAVGRIGAHTEKCSFRSPWDTVCLDDGGDDCCVLLKTIADVEAKVVRSRDKIVRFCRRLDPFAERVNGMPDPEGDRLVLEAAGGVFSPSEADLADLQACRILRDPGGIVAGWRAEIADFPAEARKLAIEHRLFFGTMWIGEDMQRAIAAGDHAHVAIKRSWAIEHFIRLLYTLNRRYYHKPKWLAQHLAGFQYKPADTLSRLSKAWSGEGSAAIEELWGLAAELIACIREGCPEADIDRVAGWFDAD
jgi:hypothetical protein